MALTRSFKETVVRRVAADPAFGEALLAEGVNALLSGEVDVGKALLRDYINATIGFAALAEAVGTPPKSLMRMFSPSGNPAARNLFAVIEHLQRSSGVRLAVHAA
ncbi:MAG: transcriptional regulator [Alphaproteobacteria bacterium]|nr:transcriptional regulator [Alphaproteobacteria bacterium]